MLFPQGQKSPLGFLLRAVACLLGGCVGSGSGLLYFPGLASFHDIVRYRFLAAGTLCAGIYVERRIFTLDRMSYQNDIDGLDNLVKSGRMSASDAAAMKDKLLHNMNNFIPHRKGGLK